MKATSLILLVVSLLFCHSVPLLSQSGTFTVHLPKLGYPPDDEGQGWSRPLVWGANHNNAQDDSIVVPNGRPIYALIVSGYSQNSNFDQLLVYRFAKHLMEHGAYVHYAWWNNLLAPYMERPLHYDQSDPGKLGQDILAFTSAILAANKAVPGEDYQFVADAKLFISAIRQHNPNAIIIVVGHSMGGGSVVHLASQTTERIDILAPIDPVGNRNYPWADIRLNKSDFNWTRWRVTRDKFLGYKRKDNIGIIIPNCVPAGNWKKDYIVAKTQSDLVCRPGAPYIHQAPRLIFQGNVVHLYHRYQKEAIFPFDFSDDYHFDHNAPPNGSTDQASIPMIPEWCGFLQRCEDPGGWPLLTLPGLFACCATGDGVGWPFDGHGEIVGHRGPLSATGNSPVPLGVRVRTSPGCGSQCPNQIWPWRYKYNGVWVDPDANVRRTHLINLENLPAGSFWDHRPTNPELCLVSSGLINLYDGIVTGIKVNSEIPGHFLLEQNYPNPFNPSTTINFSLASPEFVTLKIFDALGREVATLINEDKNAGAFAIEWNAIELPSGSYFYRIQAGSFVETKKMILMK